MANDLTIGTLLESQNSAPARLLASKMNRHTFWCGQSGSGKTYALGVALEQILLHTRLPIVILDPNSDFVKLGELRPDAPAAEAAELATRDIRVRRSTRVSASRCTRGSSRCRCARGRRSCRSTRCWTPMTTTPCCAWRPTCIFCPITIWWDSCARTPTACAISWRCVSRISASPNGSCGRGVSGMSRKTSTIRRMRPWSISAASPRSPSRARPRSLCSIICGTTASSGSAA